ncbi:LysR family transcriptional regulator [Facilibium subflavum]|uniref:LysR family transcriptional regulator n=1 Tax=Facilibium subflavum TaxID=2219058 RepID=UPI000E65BDB1|nr:LysR family transcriptional regulator [Facilibium subflavum]
MNITLLQFKIFNNLAKTQSFRQTAKIMQLPVSRVSNAIKALETHYQTPLFFRNTRQVKLTENGQKIWPSVKMLLSSDQQIQDTIQHRPYQHFGHLKIGIPLSLFHQVYIEHLHELNTQYPNLTIDWRVGNFLPHLISDDFDAIIFCGHVPNIDAYATEIGQWSKLTCASSDYLSNHPSIHTPDDLTKHTCLDHSDNFTAQWQYYINNQQKDIVIKRNRSIKGTLPL